MDDNKLAEYIDQSRWLLNNGLVTDDVKNQLFFYGSIVHKNVQAVELDLVPDNKVINYRIYVDKKLIKKIYHYRTLSKSTDLFGLWKFKRFLKKEGSLDFHQILNKFVVDLCGPQWSATAQIIDIDKYTEDVNNVEAVQIQNNQLGESHAGNVGSQQPDKLPDQ